MLRSPQIANPKRHLDPEEAAARRLFPYYAGFSASFVESTLRTLDLDPGAKVLDPWNGSGTTTLTAFANGLTAIGSDLNPVMVLVAKATFVSRLDIESLVPLAHSIVDKIDNQAVSVSKDPLSNWFHPGSVSLLRGIEDRVNRTLICHDVYTSLDAPEFLEKVTPLAAFFYLALFRIARRWVNGFVASNPTWIRVARTTAEKKRLTKSGILRGFLEEVQLLSQRREQFLSCGVSDQTRIRLLLSNAEALPLQSKSIDAIIGSPPYCTRIDYAVATYIELAMLRIGEERFSDLRRKLTGSSTVRKDEIAVNPKWGKACGNFLRKIYNHPSKASQGYYYKSHLQYFESIYRSLSEAQRVLSRKAPCALVVQNSYYKEIRNDVAVIMQEMSQNLGMSLVRRADFSASRSMVDVNQRSRRYVGDRSTIESVMFLRKD